MQATHSLMDTAIEKCKLLFLPPKSQTGTQADQAGNSGDGEGEKGDSPSIGIESVNKAEVDPRAGS
jgi:hypothetical protein